MSNINVSYTEMETAALQLGAGRDEIISKLQGMQAHIQQLITSGFITDQASGRFGDAFLRYTSTANSLIEELTEIQGFLTSTATAMHDLDVQIASRIQ